MASAQVTKEDLKKWNIGLAVVYVLQAIALLFLSVNKLVTVNLSFITKDTLASELSGQSVYGTALRRLFDVNIVHILAVALLVMAIAHFALAMIARSRYEAGLAKNLNKYRWTIMGVGASLLLIAIALLAGVNTLNVLVPVAALVGAASTFACMMEQRNAKQKKIVWRPFAASAVFGALAFLTVGLSLIGSRLYGTGPALYVCILFWSAALIAALSAVMTWRFYRRNDQKRYLNLERAYALVALVFVSAVVWQIFVSALQP